MQIHSSSFIYIISNLLLFVVGDFFDAKKRTWSDKITGTQPANKASKTREV